MNSFVVTCKSYCKNVIESNKALEKNYADLTVSVLSKKPHSRIPTEKLGSVTKVYSQSMAACSQLLALTWCRRHNQCKTIENKRTKDQRKQ